MKNKLRALFYLCVCLIFTIFVITKKNAIQTKRCENKATCASLLKMRGKPIVTAPVEELALKVQKRVSLSSKKGRLCGSIPPNLCKKIEVGHDIALNDGLVGTVARISPHTDFETGLYSIEVQCTQDVPKAIAYITTKTCLKTPCIPKSALHGKTVWLAENGVATKKEVVVGEKTKTHVQILKGLKLCDRVIVEGSSILKQGDRIFSGDAS